MGALRKLATVMAEPALETQRSRKCPQCFYTLLLSGLALYAMSLKPNSRNPKLFAKKNLSKGA